MRIYNDKHLKPTKHRFGGFFHYSTIRARLKHSSILQYFILQIKYVVQSNKDEIDLLYTKFINVILEINFDNII